MNKVTTTRKIAAAAVMAFAFVACKEEYTSDFSTPAENTIAFECTASINGSPVLWTETSRIGFFSDAYGQVNTPVTASASSAGQEAGFFWSDLSWGGVDDGLYEFHVYYPYNQSNSSTLLSGSVASQQSQSGTSTAHLSQYSLMAASVSTEAKPVGESVEVKFTNVFDVMELEVKTSSRIGWNLESISLEPSGASLAGGYTYDLKTGALTMTDTDAGVTLNITDTELAADPFHGYAMVAMPEGGATCKVTVVVTKGEESYALVSEGVSLAGKMTLEIDGYDETVLADTAVDLSRYEGKTVTANCYVADEAGVEYKFPATVMGNGYTTPATSGYDHNGDAAGFAPETLSPASAKILWQTAPGLLTNIRLRSGYVYFTTAGETGNALQSGNAVIAVMDATGNILWSWHIWVTDADLEGKAVKYTIHENYAQYSEYADPVMMDRNLGALTDLLTNMSGDNGSYGLFYQWGRKDPFPGSDDSGYTSTTYRSTYNAEGNLLDPLPVTGGTSPSTANEWDAVTVGLSDADMNRYPMTFVYTAPMWTAEVHDDYWGNPYSAASSNESGHKSIHDPCPPGWRVPHTYVWSGLTDEGADGLKNNFSQWHVVWGGSYSTDSEYQTYIKSNGGLVFNTGSGTATYPSNGMIFNDKGTLKLYRVGNYVSGCWTNMPNTNNNAYRFYFDYANLNLRNTNARIIGHAVRCMKDTDY